MKRSTALLPSAMAAGLMALPRLAVSYGFYVFVPVIISLNRTGLIIIVFSATVTLGATFVSSLFELVSWTNAALQFALILPFLIAVLGGNASTQFIDPLATLRFLNVILAVGGLFGLIDMGFPLELPYIDYRPDYYWGFFGMGGAKILTICGFFGLVAEYSSRHVSRPRYILIFSIISVANFLIPNFLLGIACGLLASGVLIIRHPTLLIGAILAAVPIGSYAMYRAANIETAYLDTYGLHPKAHQFVIAAETMAEYPHTVVFGSGPGQYGGQAAMWASPAGQLTSSHSVPNLPGMFPSEIHRAFLEPALLRFRDNIWAIGSSSNKPYSSFTVILVEHGVIAFLIILFLLLRKYFRSMHLPKLCVGVFVFLILLIDTQHDSPWFGFCLILINSILGAKSNVINQNSENTGVQPSE